MPEDEVSDADMASGPDSGGVAFRISVDLSEYFQQPARCFLSIPRPRESRTVRWLARRLRRTAALRERFCLLCASHVLPPDEPLTLLRPGDSLHVVRAEHEWQRVFSFRGERLPPAPPPKPKKRRHADTVEAESPLNPAVSKSKPKLFPSPQFPTPPSAVSLPPSQMTIPPPSLSMAPPSLSKAPPATLLPPSVLPPTSPAPITKPSQDEELQRVKRRALALLQKVEGNIPPRGQEGVNGEAGVDEPDGPGDEWLPAKKRRRRVRRRRTLPPIDFEQEMGLANARSSTPAQTATLVLPVSPKLPLIEAPPSTPEVYLTPAVSTTPATSILAPSILGPPSTPIPSLSLASPPGPVVVREAMVPRAPRLVRALDNTRSDDANQPSIENVSAAPSVVPQTAVQCS